MSWPEDVGIVALEVYIPKTYVAHDQLEVFDGASTGWNFRLNFVYFPFHF